MNHRLALVALLATGCAIPERDWPLEAPSIARFEAWRVPDEAPRVRWAVEGEVERVELILPGGTARPSSAPELELELPEVQPGDRLELVAIGPGGETRARTRVPTVENALVRLLAFEVGPVSVRADEPVRIRWVTENARRVVLMEGGVEVETQLPAQGSRIRRPQRTTEFGLRVEGFGGPIDERVEVEVADAPPILHRFQAMPVEVALGESSSLQWFVERASALRLFGIDPEGARVLLLSEAPADGNGATTVAPPLGVHRYELEIDGAGITRRAEASVSVIPAESPLIVSFTTTPSVSGVGGDVAVAWSVRGATEVELRIDDAPSSPVAAVGSRLLRANAARTDLQLLASSPSGSVQRTVQVRTSPALPSIASFVGAPLPTGRGEPIDLSWNVSDALQVWIEDGLGRRLVENQPAPEATVQLEASTVLSLVASNANGQTFRRLVAEVGDRPQIHRLRALDPQVRIGRPARWTWSLSDADERFLNTPGRAARLLRTDSGTVALRRADLQAEPDATLIARNQLLLTTTATADVELLPRIEGGRDTEPNDSWALAQTLSGLGGRLAGTLEGSDTDHFAFELPTNTRPALDGCPMGLRMDAWALDEEGAPIGPTLTVDPVPCGELEAALAPLGPNLGLRLARSDGAPDPASYSLDFDARFEGCGDGVIGYGELCDDGNSSPGDGCDGLCHPEDVDEREPNGTRPSATVVTTGRFRGAVHAFDVDLFALMVPDLGVPPSGRWRFAVSDRDGLGCSVDLQLELLDPLGAVLARDEADGLGCPVLSSARTVLGPGVYFLRVRPGPGRFLPPRGLYLIELEAP